MSDKPTAIMLTYKNIDTISVELGLDSPDILEELEASIKSGEPFYYVKDCLFKSTRMPYMIYRDREFLLDFASKPKGIEDRFVPVTQVKDGP